MRAGGGPGKDQSSGGGELSSDSEYTWKFKVTVFSDRWAVSRGGGVGGGEVDKLKLAPFFFTYVAGRMINAILDIWNIKSILLHVEFEVSIR